MRKITSILAATAAASCLFVHAGPAAAEAQTVDSAGVSSASGVGAAPANDVDAAQSRGGGGRSFGGGGGGRSFGGGGGGRSFGGGGGGGGRSFGGGGGSGARAFGGGGGGRGFSAPSRPGGGSQFGAAPRAGGTPFSGGQGGRGPLAGQGPGNGQGGRGPLAGQGPGNGQGGRGPLAGQGPGNGQGGRGPLAGQGPGNGQGGRGPLAGQGPGNGQGGRGPLVGQGPSNGQGGRGPLAPGLRSGLGAGGLAAGLPRSSSGGAFGRSGLPVSRPVGGNTFQRGRIGLPLTLAPRHTFSKPVSAPLQPRWRPFVQRHWRRTFLWVAVAGIGYVTVPEFGYQKFLTFVERDEPDYAGAVSWLNECAAIDEGHEVPRAAPPAKVVHHTVVKVEPPAQLDERFTRFVNRRWNVPYVWVDVPRIGQVTVPQASADQVQQHLAGDPPNFDAALAALEEAAASDTVVAEAPQAEAPSQEAAPSSEAVQ